MSRRLTGAVSVCITSLSLRRTASGDDPVQDTHFRSSFCRISAESAELTELARRL
eukprot:CAMPEP_0181417910 /NCGR_PEP_ID=MMETSP1110-20121109/11285_1 /TAXON_ID=174948 /ORGANISM="Symbiodinium sp., Strain CCMP421" /LENGTH=54 /DNA_ID=CAMNT_0023540877 /DNA_START=219 /DNA_END=380 /DNA_ORIENTATION=-